VRWLRLEQLADLVHGNTIPSDLRPRAQATVTPPLPAVFRLSATGTIIPVVLKGTDSTSGLAVGSGRGVGRVCERRGGCGGRDGEVLVVRTLDPSLAASLPGLAGLVSETGGALSHLAILAREQRVPVVVGVPDAVRRFPPGTRVLVDGDVGNVVALPDRENP
jgi:pyruvate,water dikinase